MHLTCSIARPAHAERDPISTNFPTSLDDNSTVSSAHANGDTIQAADDNNQSLAIKALEAKVGIDSSAVATSHDYKLAHFAHSSLTGVGANDHHAQSHGSEHAAGGSDPIVGAPAVRTVGADYFIYKSGSNYIAFRTADGSTPYTSTNAASVINSAAAVLAAANGGVIQLEGKTTFNCTSTVTIGGGVKLWGGAAGASEGGSVTPQLVASSNLGSGGNGAHPLIRLAGFGSSVAQVNTNAQGNATECIYASADACSIVGGFHQGGTVHTISNSGGSQVASGPSGNDGDAPRQRWSNLRCDNNNQGTAGRAVMELFSTDHIVYDVVCTGTSSKAQNALRVNGNNGMFGLMHLTGGGNSLEALRCDGSGNGFSVIKTDTVGSGAKAYYLVSGSHNTFGQCSGENAANGVNKPLIAIDGAYGNIFSGVDWGPAAGGGQATGLIRFMSGSSTASSLTAFKGTQITFGTGSLDNISGSLCQPMPTSGNGIWIQGYVNSGTASGTYNITG